MTATKRRQSPRTRASASAAKPSKTANKVTAPKSKHYTRPGVEAAARLASLQPPSDHASKWERALSYYPAMIKAKGGAELVKLDKQREDMAKGWTATSASESENNEQLGMTKDQLLDVMVAWKFLKGKPRNALKPLLKSNSDASVTKATKQAFEIARGIPTNDNGDNHIKQMTVAMNHICELKGVGPATASAILCLYRPDIFAFMDDEVIECLYDKKRGYTMKIYMEVNERCREIATEINEGREKDAQDGSSSGWTPCKVGKALWTMAKMAATNEEDGLSAIFESEDDSTNSRKRTKKR